MSTIVHNPYSGLALDELKILRRAAKDPVKQKAVDEAIAAFNPFRSGRLNNEEMSLIGKLVIGRNNIALDHPDWAQAVTILNKFTGPAPIPQPRSKKGAVVATDATTGNSETPGAATAAA